MDKNQIESGAHFSLAAMMGDISKEDESIIFDLVLKVKASLDFHTKKIESPQTQHKKKDKNISKDNTNVLEKSCKKSFSKEEAFFLGGNKELASFKLKKY